MSSTRNPKKNASELEGTFGPWNSVESGFPWAFYQVEVLLLLKLLKIQSTFYSRAVQLLEQSPLPNPIDKHGRDFLKKVAQLTDAERRSCCWINSAGVYVRDGYALFTNPWKQGETLFQSNPMGRLSNALFCIQDEWIRRNPSSFGKGYIRCDSLAFSPTDVRGNAPTASISPWLYTGGSDYRPFLGTLRNDHWLREMEKSYWAASKRLAKAWVRQAPGAVRPNPVYQFIVDPTVQLRHEAGLFMRLVLGDGAPRTAESNERPPQFNKGFVVCSTSELNLALANNRRTPFVDRNLLSPLNPSGTIWQKPETGTRRHKHEFWFSDEALFQAAKRALRGRV